MLFPARNPEWDDGPLAVHPAVAGLGHDLRILQPEGCAKDFGRKSPDPPEGVVHYGLRAPQSATLKKGGTEVLSSSTATDIPEVLLTWSYTLDPARARRLAQILFSPSTGAGS